MSHSAYITSRIIMPLRRSCHMPIRKLIPPLTLTGFASVLVQSATWNSCLGRQISIFSAYLQIADTSLIFEGIMTWNNPKIIANTPSSIFKWCRPFVRRGKERVKRPIVPTWKREDRKGNAKVNFLWRFFSTGSKRSSNRRSHRCNFKEFKTFKVILPAEARPQLPGIGPDNCACQLTIPVLFVPVSWSWSQSRFEIVLQREWGWVRWMNFIIQFS